MNIALGLSSMYHCALNSVNSATLYTLHSPLQLAGRSFTSFLYSLLPSSSLFSSFLLPMLLQNFTTKLWHLVVLYDNAVWNKNIRIGTLMTLQTTKQMVTHIKSELWLGCDNFTVTANTGMQKI